MKYLRTEISQLGRLLELEVPYGTASVNHPWIHVVHPVYVGPYLDFLSAERNSRKGSCVVGPTPLEVVDFILGILAYEPLGKEHLSFGMSFDHRDKAGRNVVRIRLSLLVQPHEIQGRQQDRLLSLLHEIQVQEPAGQQFALSHQNLFLSGGEQFLGECLEVVKDLLYVLEGLIPGGIRPVQAGDDPLVL